jgi:hypothetical protein
MARHTSNGQINAAFGCGVALGKEDFSLSMRGNGPALGGGRQKSCGIKSPRAHFGASVQFSFCHRLW